MFAGTVHLALSGTGFARCSLTGSDAPRTSLTNLVSEGITHVMSILTGTGLEQPDLTQASGTLLNIKQVIIRDDPQEDILIHLDDVAQWVDEILRQDNNQILIYCAHNTSCLSSIVIGFRKFTLTKHALLSMI